MKVEIEVPVAVWGRCKSGQSERRVFGSIPALFEIPEYSASEVPLVLTYEQEFGRGTKRTEFFGIDGHLYFDRAASPSEEAARVFRYQRNAGENPPHPFFSAAQEYVENETLRIRREGFKTAGSRMIPRELAEYCDGDLKQDGFPWRTLSDLGFVSNSHSEEVAQAQLRDFAKRMERFVCVGGRLMVREQEPMVRVKGTIMFGTRLAAALERREETAPLERIDEFETSRTVAFVSLSDFGRMQERLEMAGGAFGCDIEFGDPLVSVEIHDSQYVTASSEAATLIAVANAMRASMAKAICPFPGNGMEASVQARLMEVSPQLLAVFHGLVAGLATSDEYQPSDALLSAMAEAVSLGASEMAAKYLGGRKLVDYAASVFDQWHDRSVSLEIASPTLAMG